MSKIQCRKATAKRCYCAPCYQARKRQELADKVESHLRRLQAWKEQRDDARALQLAEAL